MAPAVAEVGRVSGERIDLADETQVPNADPATYELIRTPRTLGMFQIESPGQRELVGKLGPSRFDDLIVDISLFRPGPVKSDMITPFLNSRHGWAQRRFLHPSLIPALEETEGVVVFHEQVLLIVAETTGVTLAQADEVRRSMGTPQGQTDVEAWWRPAAKARGYSADDRDTIWEVLKSFASFGLCKAPAAAVRGTGCRSGDPYRARAGNGSHDRRQLQCDHCRTVCREHRTQFGARSDPATSSSGQCTGQPRPRGHRQPFLAAGQSERAGC